MQTVLESEIIPPDSGSGALGRMNVETSGGGRVATLETLWEFFLDMVNDPDGAMRKDPNFLEKLMTHPQVSACMNLREQNVASMTTTVKIAKKPKNEDLAKELAEYVDEVWESIDNKDALFQQMQSAVLHGGIGHEWMWTHQADKVDGNTQRPEGFFPVHKTRFTFDRRGQMCLRTRKQMVWGGYLGVTPSDPGHSTELPMGKFTYHVYEQVPGSWYKPESEGFIYYGRGEDEDLYDLVTRDLACWYLQMEWLRQYGNPPRILYTPDSSPQWDNIVNQFAQRLKVDSLVPINGKKSEGLRLFELVNAEVPNPSFDAFGKSRDRHYNDIEGILLGAVGALSQQDKGGYAGHKSRQNSGPDKLAERDATRIGSTLSSQLVPAIVKYGPEKFRTAQKADLPKIVLYDEGDLDVETLKGATELVPVGKTFIYRRLNIDEPEEDEDTVFNGGQQDPYGELDKLNGGKNPAETGDEPRAAIGDKDKPDNKPEPAEGDE